MQSNVDSYLAIFRMGIKNAIVYKMDFLLSLFFRVATALIMIFIWSAIYLTTNTTKIGSFTLPTMYAYFFIVTAFTAIINTNMDEYMINDVRDGSITTGFIKPISYPIQLFVASIADSLMNSIIVGVPLILISMLLIHLSLTPVMAVLLVADVLLAFILVNIIGFILGCFAIYLIDVWGILTVTWSIVMFLSGSTIPLNLFPNAVKNVLFLTPFPIIAYTPTTMLLGTTTIQTVISSLIVGTFWVAIMLIAAFLWWRKSSRNLTSAGG